MTAPTTAFAVAPSPTPGLIWHGERNDAKPNEGFLMDY